MTAEVSRPIVDAVQLVIDQANRDHGRLTPSSILILATIRRDAEAQAKEIRQLRIDDASRRARTLDDGKDAGGNIVPPALLEHADRLGATGPDGFRSGRSPVASAAGSVPVGPALVLIRHRLRKVTGSVYGHAGTEARGLRELAAIVDDLVMVLEQLELRAPSVHVDLAGNKPPVYPSQPDVSR